MVPPGYYNLGGIFIRILNDLIQIAEFILGNTFLKRELENTCDAVKYSIVY